MMHFLNHLQVFFRQLPPSTQIIVTSHREIPVDLRGKRSRNKRQKHHLSSVQKPFDIPLKPYWFIDVTGILILYNPHVIA